MPTRRCMRPRTPDLGPRSSILVAIPERDVPGVGVLVETGRDLGAVDLDDELHRGLHDEVARFAEDLAEAGMQRERANLVGVGLPRLPIDPAQQRLDALLIVWIAEEIDEERDPAA